MTIKNGQTHSCDGVGKIYDDAYNKYSEIRPGLWSRIGDTPVQTAVRLVLNYHGQKERLKVSDIGCGLGEEMVLLPKRLKDAAVFGEKAFLGDVECVGCDVSENMVAHARREGNAGVKQGDFRYLTDHLKDADLVWANLSLIHFPMPYFPSALEDLVSLGAPGAIIAMGFKTGNDVTRMERKESRISGERVTTYARVSTVQGLFRAFKCEVQATIEIPAESINDANGYAWVFARKAPEEATNWPRKLENLIRLASPDGVVGMGFKVGDDVEIIDPADEHTPVDRFTSLPRMETLRNHLLALGVTELHEFQCDPSSTRTEPVRYPYGWIIGKKTAAPGRGGRTEKRSND